MELLILAFIALIIWFFISDKPAFEDFVDFLKYQFNKLKDFIIGYIRH